LTNIPPLSKVNPVVA